MEWQNSNPQFSIQPQPQNRSISLMIIIIFSERKPFFSSFFNLKNEDSTPGSSASDQRRSWRTSCTPSSFVDPNLKKRSRIRDPSSRSTSRLAKLSKRKLVWSSATTCFSEEFEMEMTNLSTRFKSSSSHEKEKQQISILKKRN